MDEIEKFSDIEIIDIVRKMVQDVGLMDGDAAEKLSPQNGLSQVSGDGSTRRFWRVNSTLLRDDSKGMIFVAPAQATAAELAESASAWRIGNHLRNSGVRVPELYGWEPKSGVLIFEDLGDVRLQDVVRNASSSDKSTGGKMGALYKEVLSGLIAMQVRSSADLSSEWCWDTPVYDASLMVARESEYFLSAFWQLFLDQNVPEGILDEFKELARRAEKAPTDYFLHRDFQSRNIMIRNGVPWFIDFQGGRRGPLGYDLASLLIDPYCGLAPEFQEELFDIYYIHLQREVGISKTLFREQYDYLALQRNLQILGAFSFLYRVRKKEFFRSFILPALVSLNTRLAMKRFDDLPTLRSMAETGLRMVGQMSDLQR